MIFLSVAVFMVLIFVLCNNKVSSFGGIKDILEDNYSDNYGCSNSVNRVPMGRLPGSTLGLTAAERKGLLISFMENKEI